MMDEVIVVFFYVPGGKTKSSAVIPELLVGRRMLVFRIASGSGGDDSLAEGGCGTDGCRIGRI